MIHVLDIEFLNSTETIAAFLLETDEGPILFECGPHSAIHGLENAIKSHGYRLKNITHLFLTHIHFDHAGAAWALAKNGTKVYVHPAGYKHLLDPSRLYASAERIYGDQMEYLWGKMDGIPEELLIEVKDGETIHVGNRSIQSLHTPGHASHHIAWKVGGNIIAGDVAGCKIDGGPVVPPCPPPDINIEDWIGSIDKISKQDFDNLYLTHFGRVSNINQHFENLKLVLWDWAHFIKPYFDEGQPVDEVVPIFSSYAKEQLINAGTNSELIAKYEKANPAWMSVAGLMRYWSKKSA